jgi:hypothetical protein
MRAIADQTSADSARFATLDFVKGTSSVPITFVVGKLFAAR